MSEANGLPAMGWDEVDQSTAANPQQFHPMMRDMGVVAAPDMDMTLITRHEDVMAALRNPEVFSSSGSIDIGNIRPLIPLQIDPPDHVKFRRLLDPLFAPREVGKLEGAVRSLVNDLIDAFVDTGSVRVQRRRRRPAAVHGVPPAHGPAARGPRPLPALQGRHHPARGADGGAARRRWRVPPAPRSTTTSSGWWPSGGPSRRTTC